MKLTCPPGNRILTYGMPMIVFRRRGYLHFRSLVLLALKICNNKQLAFLSVIVSYVFPIPSLDCSPAFAAEGGKGPCARSRGAIQGPGASHPPGDEGSVSKGNVLFSNTHVRQGQKMCQKWLVYGKISEK